MDDGAGCFAVIVFFTLRVCLCVLCLFLDVPLVGLCSMIAAFPDNTQSFLAGVNLSPVEFLN